MAESASTHAHPLPSANQLFMRHLPGDVPETLRMLDLTTFSLDKITKVSEVDTFINRVKAAVTRTSGTDPTVLDSCAWTWTASSRADIGQTDNFLGVPETWNELTELAKVRGFEKWMTLTDSKDDLARVIAYAELVLSPVMDKDEFTKALKLPAGNATEKRAKQAAVMAALASCWEISKGTSVTKKLRHTLKSIRRLLSDYLENNWLRQRVLTGLQVRNFRELRELIIRSKNLTETLEDHCRISDLAKKFRKLRDSPDPTFTVRMLELECAFEPYLAEVQGTSSKYINGAYENDLRPSAGDQRLSPPTSADLADLRNETERVTPSMRTMWLAMSLAPLPDQAIVRIEDEFIRNHGDLSPFTLAQNRYAFHELVSKHEKANPQATKTVNRLNGKRIHPKDLTSEELADGVEKLHVQAMQRWDDSRFDRAKAPRYSEYIERAKGSTENRNERLAHFTGKEVCRNCLLNNLSSPLHLRSSCNKPLNTEGRARASRRSVSALRVRAVEGLVKDDSDYEDAFASQFPSTRHY